MIATKQLFSCALLVSTLVACSTAPVVSPETAAPANASEALFHALSTLDIDYRRGGHKPASGFDCSGLVQYVYHTAYGIQLPRVARDQGRAGKAVEREALQPGDLVFYNTLREPYSHVGIYIGDDRFVHAPKTGAAVRVESMRAAYWTRRYDGARRILH
jgi:cell wall-associated NlpC family hydrolase